VYQPKKMTPDQLYEGITKAWNETYSLPAIAKRLSPFDRAPLVAGVTNLLGYRGYAKKFEQFPRERMLDNTDIPVTDVPPARAYARQLPVLP
jgi:hypothetical protein